MTSASLGATHHSIFILSSAGREITGGQENGPKEEGWCTTPQEAALIFGSPGEIQSAAC
jgi:hypothetical protein